MTDVRLQSALARLAPDVDDFPAWDDVVRRGGVGPRVRWRLAAVAVAMVLTTGLVAGALAEGLLSRSLDRLSGWVGDQPGEPAPEQQTAFDQENAASYAHFPSGTRVGRLLTFDVWGQRHELLGFRDGTNLCLRIVPALFPGTFPVPECVPQQLLARLVKPVVVLGGHIRAGDPSTTIVYGLAADSVKRIDVRENGEALGEAVVDNNAFLIAAPDRPPDPRRNPREWPRIVVRAHGPDGFGDYPVSTGPMFPNRSIEELPGPDHVERTLETGSIGWLQRRQPRGEPFEWPYNFPDRVLYSRMLTPDPESSFRLAIAYGEDADWRENGRWYCTAWLWPLLPESRISRGCGRVSLIDNGLTMQGRWGTVGQEFPHHVGIASDEVTRIEIFYEDGTTQQVPINDNVFAFHVSSEQESKLVAYDHQGRVVNIVRLGKQRG